MTEQTHFGFESVAVDEKELRVGAVFNSVASKYDVMNDAMSLGIHRFWKEYFVWQTEAKAGEVVLDLAAGTADISTRLAKRMLDKHRQDVEGQLIVSDINAAMLSRGQARLTNEGWLKNVSFVLANAEKLPFADNSVDLITMAFGLRNVTRQDKALSEMQRVLKSGGRALVLEFSKPIYAPLSSAYDWYSFNVLPKLGRLIADDEESYRYLAESIRMHPAQETLKTMFETAGFVDVAYQNLSAGIVAIHRGVKP